MSGSRELFAELFARGAASGELNDLAWVRALLDFEVALARALARAGLVSESAADTVAAAATPDRISLAGLAAGSGKTGSPIPALVKQLESDLPLLAAPALHRGATSQDAIDTALMLMAKRALGHVIADLDAAAQSTAELARTHRDSVMLGRTLLQAAVPITFGGRSCGQRAAGAWHAEWETLTELLSLLGSAANWLREVIAGLSVHTERMRANLDAMRGLPLAERLSSELALRVGHERADALLQVAIERTRSEGLHLREAILHDADLSRALHDAGMGPEELAHAFEPSEYLGSSSPFIDRALAVHASRRSTGLALLHCITSSKVAPSRRRRCCC